MDKDKKIIIKVRAIILHNEKLLTVEHPHDKTFVALPGGHLEWGEDLKECLSREMIEELGVKPDVGRLFYVNVFTQEKTSKEDYAKKGFHYVEFFFEVKNGIDYLDTEKLARSHAHEITKIIWVSPTDNVRILPKILAEDFKAGKVVSDEVRYNKE
ncbi:MAG: NUDIX domain-containing protein [Patescibacteria group bacterium]